MTENIAYNTFNPDSYFAKTFSETFGLVEANSNEMHEMYFRLQRYGYAVEQIAMGTGIEIGRFHGAPVFVTFNWFRINGVLVGFWSADSVVVNYDMIRIWIHKNLPHIKANSDATNIHTTLHALGIEQTEESVAAALEHIEWNHSMHKIDLQRKMADIKLENARKALKAL